MMSHALGGTRHKRRGLTGIRRERGLWRTEEMIDTDAVLKELGHAREAEETPVSRPPAIDKIRYTHADMIDFIIANPGISQNALAARYGYTVGWVSQVMSSDAWQSAMAARRAEVVDPTLVATIDERFRALTNRSLDRLMQKLEAPQVSDQVVLRAVELGAKAMGVGGHAPAAPPPADHLAQLANRLLDLQSRVRGNVQQGVTLDGQATEVRDDAS